MEKCIWNDSLLYIHCSVAYVKYLAESGSSKSIECSGPLWKIIMERMQGIMGFFFLIYLSSCIERLVQRFYAPSCLSLLLCAMLFSVVYL